jgi:hypothetical protein
VDANETPEGAEPDPEAAAELFGEVFESLESEYGDSSAEELFDNVLETPTSEVDTTLESGCTPGCLMSLVGVMVLMATSIVVFSQFSVFDGDPSDAPSEGESPTQAPEAASPDVGGSSPLYENEFDADGNLVPIPGEWHVYNDAGVDACTYDISVDASVQRMELDVLDGGGRISIREIFDDESVGPVFVLDRISSSDTEVTYREDLSEMVGRDQAIEGTFSSSSTWGGRVEGCAERGAQGSLVQPFEE